MQIALAKELKVGARVHYGPVPGATPARLQPCLELVVTRVKLKWRASGLGVRSWAGTNILQYVEAAEIGLPGAKHYFHPSSRSLTSGTLKHLHLASTCPRATTQRLHLEAYQVKWPQYSDADLHTTS